MAHSSEYILDKHTSFHWDSIGVFHLHSQKHLYTSVVILSGKKRKIKQMWRLLHYYSTYWQYTVHIYHMVYFWLLFCVMLSVLQFLNVFHHLKWHFILISCAVNKQARMTQVNLPKPALCYGEQEHLVFYSYLYMESLISVLQCFLLFFCSLSVILLFIPTLPLFQTTNHHCALFVFRTTKCLFLIQALSLTATLSSLAHCLCLCLPLVIYGRQNCWSAEK